MNLLITNLARERQYYDNSAADILPYGRWAVLNLYTIKIGHSFIKKINRDCVVTEDRYFRSGNFLRYLVLISKDSYYVEREKSYLNKQASQQIKVHKSVFYFKAWGRR